MPTMVFTHIPPNTTCHIVDTVAGCEKHTPAHCALCPFDFTPMNTL